MSTIGPGQAADLRLEGFTHEIESRRDVWWLACDQDEEPTGGDGVGEYCTGIGYVPYIPSVTRWSNAYSSVEYLESFAEASGWYIRIGSKGRLEQFWDTYEGEKDKFLIGCEMIVRSMHRVFDVESVPENKLLIYVFSSGPFRENVPSEN